MDDLCKVTCTMCEHKLGGKHDRNFCNSFHMLCDYEYLIWRDLECGVPLLLLKHAKKELKKPHSDTGFVVNYCLPYGSYIDDIRRINEFIK